jgi:hypothetical protein
MLENRSFDHMLGFCDLSGTDAVSGAPTRINGLISPPAGAVTSNAYDGQQFSVTLPADYAMPVDPGHEFPAVLEQLCGSGAVYARGGAYPAILNSGFAASYTAASKAAGVQRAALPGEFQHWRMRTLFVLCPWHAGVTAATRPDDSINEGNLRLSPDRKRRMKLWTCSRLLRSES